MESTQQEGPGDGQGPYLHLPQMQQHADADLCTVMEEPGMEQRFRKEQLRGLSQLAELVFFS